MKNSHGDAGEKRHFREPLSFPVWDLGRLDHRIVFLIQSLEYQPVHINRRGDQAVCQPAAMAGLKSPCKKPSISRWQQADRIYGRGIVS